MNSIYCLLNSIINNKIPANEIYAIFDEANEISSEFINNAIQSKLIGISSDSMNIYVKYVKTLVPNWKIHIGKTEIKDILYDKMIIHPEDMYCSLCEI